MAGFATGAEFAFPFLHDFVDLLAGEVPGQDLEIGGVGMDVLFGLGSGLGGGLACGSGRGTLRGQDKRASRQQR